MGNTFAKKPTVSYSKVLPTNDETALSTETKPTEQVVVNIDTEIETKKGYKKVTFSIDHDAFVKLFMDPKIELNIGSMAYLIGYKMVYVVDEYRERIPNVIAIVTLKINEHNNAIFQSEKSMGHNKKEHYRLLELSNKIGKDAYYNRDQQAESLKHTGGNMIAWEHSTKYCAHNVETLALTFCGKFRDVINACKKYDTNLAFAESAYTYEERMDPIVYEVGTTNYSKHDRPNVASGGCLDFFHFFLRPEYAIDYGFWQFQFAEGRSDVNRSEIVLGKKFSDLRKVNYDECEESDSRRDRTGVRLIPSQNGFTSNQLLINAQRDGIVNAHAEIEVDNVMAEIEKEMQNASTEEKLVASAFSMNTPVTQDPGYAIGSINSDYTSIERADVSELRHRSSRKYIEQ